VLKEVVVPETALSILVAPVDVNVILPLGEPVAAAAILTKMVVEATEPPDWVNVKELANPVDAFVEISKPVGAEILIFAVRLHPSTVKV
jgi:hypothetical protein